MILENGYKLSFPKNLQFSDDEFFEFCQQNADLNIERDENCNIIIMSPSGNLSSNWNNYISGMLMLWNLQTKKGKTFDSSVGFTFPDNSVRSPDASWVSNEKWNHLTLEQKKKFAPVCPEFVVEVKSPSDSLKELKEKMQMYLSNGVLLGWLFDVENEMVYIYSPQGESLIKDYEQCIKADETLPGFELDLKLLKQG